MAKVEIPRTLPLVVDGGQNNIYVMVEHNLGGQLYNLFVLS